MSTQPALPTLVSVTPLAPSPSGAAPSAAARESFVRRAQLLARAGISWHAIEAGVAVAAGVAASSIALVGFGADSLIEAGAGVVVLWLFSGSRRNPAVAERRAQQLIAFSFYVLALYVGVTAVRDLAGGTHPHTSWVGIGLAAFTAMAMPPFAIAKGRVSEALGSSAAKSESRQTLLCAYLSLALLIGLGGNAAFGWWWLDPVTALVIAAVALREGQASWRGQSCCTTPIAVGNSVACADDCCRP